MTTVRFIPDVGFHISHDGRSMLLHMAASGGSFSDRELVSFYEAVSRHMEGMQDLPTATGESLHLRSVTAAEPTDDVAYKAVDDDYLAYLRQGCLRVGTAAHYRLIERGAAYDPREARGLLVLTGEDGKSFIADVTAGFDQYLFCMARSARSWQRRHLEKFGKNLVRISGLREFSLKIADVLGATAVNICDVVYSDVKLFKLKDDRSLSIRSALGVGDLSDARLSALAEGHMSFLIDTAAFPVMFTKNTNYRTEIERRLSFKMPSDVEAPYLDIQVRDILKHLEFLEF